MAVRSRWLGGLVAAVVLLASSAPAYAMQAFRDDFLAGTTPAAVGSATTAYLDTANQTIVLPSPPDTVATGLAAGTTVTVLDGTAINTYQWTGSGMALNPNLSLAPSAVTDPLGVAVVDPGTLAVLTSGGVQVYQYTGSGMTQNPSLAWTGVTTPLTVTASHGQLAVATQQNVQVAALTQAGWAAEATVTPSGTPWDASLTPDGGGLWTIAGGTMQEYMQTGSGWGTNPNLAVTGAQDPVAVTGNEGQVTAISSGSVDTYNFTGAGWTENPLLSIGPGLTQPTAVAMIPGQESLSVLDGTTLKLFAYTGGGMSEVAAARVGGIQQIYVPQATADSPVYTPSTGYEGATLRPDLLLNGGFDTGNLNDWNINQGSWSGASSVSVESANVMTGPYAAAVNVAADMPGPTSYGLFNEISGLTSGDEYLLTAWLDVPAGGSVVWGKEGINEVVQGSTGGWQMVSMVFQMTSGADPAIVFYNNLGAGAAGYTFYLDDVSLVDLSQTSNANLSTPSGTSIKWAISLDGGSTWQSVPWGGAVQTTTPSNAWQWQATLATTNPAATPTISAPITMLLANPPDAPTPVTMTPTDSQGSVTSLSPTVGWTFQGGGGGWDSQSAYEVVVTDTTSGQVLYNSGKVSILTNPSEPPDGSSLTANDPSGSDSSLDIPGTVLLDHPEITVQVRTWDLLDLMSPWASANFNVFAVGPLAVTKIYDPPSPDPNTALPTISLPVTVLAGAQFDFTLGSTGSVTGITAQFSDGGAPVALSAEQPTSDATNTWDGSYYTNGNLSTGTTVTVTFTATSSRTGDQLVTGSVPIVVTDGSVYSQYFMILTQ